MVSLKNNDRIQRVMMAVGGGTVTGLLVAIVGACLLSFLIHKNRIGLEQTGIWLTVVLLLSSFSGALVAGKGTKENRLPAILATGLCYFIVLLSCTALFFGGEYQGIWITLLVISAGTVSCAILCLKRKVRKHITRRRF